MIEGTEYRRKQIIQQNVGRLELGCVVCEQLPSSLLQALCLNGVSSYHLGSQLVWFTERGWLLSRGCCGEFAGETCTWSSVRWTHSWRIPWRWAAQACREGSVSFLESIALMTPHSQPARICVSSPLFPLSLFSPLYFIPPPFKLSPREGST